MKLNKKLVIKFDPILEFEKLGNLNIDEISYIKSLLPDDFFSTYKLIERVILLAASGYFFKDIGLNNNLLVELFEATIRLILNKDNSNNLENTQMPIIHKTKFNNNNN